MVTGSDYVRPLLKNVHCCVSVVKRLFQKWMSCSSQQNPISSSKLLTVSKCVGSDPLRAQPAWRAAVDLGTWSSAHTKAIKSVLNRIVAPIRIGRQLTSPMSFGGVGASNGSTEGPISGGGRRSRCKSMALITRDQPLRFRPSVLCSY